MVHAVLEQLFELPAAERTLEAARELLPEVWQRMAADEPDIAALFDEAGTDDDADGTEPRPTGWRPRRSCSATTSRSRIRRASSRWPASSWSRSSSTGCGCAATSTASTRTTDGELRVVDYKTGATPREAFEAKALFQMKFYALVLWRTRGIVPKQLRLMYLADTDTLSYEPDAEELTRFERTVQAIWAAIERATREADFRPSPGRLCEWCDHHDLCPAFGGTPPPFPSDFAHWMHAETNEP